MINRFNLWWARRERRKALHFMDSCRAIYNMYSAHRDETPQQFAELRMHIDEELKDTLRMYNEGAEMLSYWDARIKQLENV